MKKIKNSLLVTGVLIGSVFATSVFAKSVNLISKEYLVKEAANNYVEVFVECSGDSDQKKVRRIAGSSDNWCSLDLPSLCRPSKMDIAKQICRAGFERLVNEYNANSEGSSEQVADNPKADPPKFNRADLLSEQLSIEEQRIQIGQRRIELRKKELELEKLELELSNQADG